MVDVWEWFLTVFCVVDSDGMFQLWKYLTSDTALPVNSSCACCDSWSRGSIKSTKRTMFGPKNNWFIHVDSVWNLYLCSVWMVWIIIFSLHWGNKSSFIILLSITTLEKKLHLSNAEMYSQVKLFFVCHKFRSVRDMLCSFGLHWREVP